MFRPNASSERFTTKQIRLKGEAKGKHYITGGNLAM